MHSNLSVKVRQIIAEHFGVDPDRLTDNARFSDDLGADWLDRLEVMIAIEDRVSGFEIADVVADQIETVGDLMRVIESRYVKKTTAGLPGSYGISPSRSQNRIQRIRT